MKQLKSKMLNSYKSWISTIGADPEEDPLKWVEENIPDIEGALPVIDLEEENETTKIEISKLQ